MSHAYVEIIRNQWENIAGLYKQFADKKPVMVVDIHAGEIYAFPYEEFKAELNRKSQLNLEQQYRRAQENNYMVVFVRDTKQGNMVSFSLELE